jgi:hypothetical protein
MSQGVRPMISKVLIQKLNGEIASDVCYAAWRGFSLRGRKTEFFDWFDLKAGKVASRAQDHRRHNPCAAEFA